MIHIATAHYRSTDWIDLQLSYFERYTAEPYRVYATTTGVDPARTAGFHWTTAPDLPLIDEVDIMTAEICAQAESPDDWIVFVHGDTLPIREWTGPVRKLLDAGNELVAIRRDENLGEPHPHWCFSVTTVGLWQRLELDWHRGPKWIGSNGVPATDMGGTLWEKFEAEGVQWAPLLRANRRDLHPLWFAAYGEPGEEPLVYHHGAGFRKPMSRLDVALSPPQRWPWMPLHWADIARRARVNAWRSRRLYRRLVAGERIWEDWL